MITIFISYSQLDREKVRLLADALSAKGWEVWWDADIRSGQNYRTQIKQALEQAACVIVAWSQHSTISNWVIDEAEFGNRKNILVPIIIENGIEPPFGFRSIQTVNLTQWFLDPSHKNSQAIFTSLCEDIKILLNQVEGSSLQNFALSPEKPSVPIEKQKTTLKIWYAITGISLLLIIGIRSYNQSSLVADTSKGKTEVLNRSESNSTRPVGIRVLKDLWCPLPSKNPILARSQENAPPEFRVDTNRHLLLNSASKPVSIVAASHVGNSLQSKRLIIVHYLAGTSKDAEKYFQSSDRPTSAHILIDKHGVVKQLVPFDIVAYHAGPSLWKQLTNLNKHSIGIELENWGRLKKMGNKWQPEFGTTGQISVPEMEIIKSSDGTISRWDKYTDAQISSFFAVSCALRRAYPTIDGLAGHNEICLPVGRKTDPGPAFPIEELRRRLFLN